MEEPQLLTIHPVSPSEHSMGARNFLRYVRSKFTDKQISLLSIAVANGYLIECHGFLCEDLKYFLKSYKYTRESDISRKDSDYHKIANSKRPSWFLAKSRSGEKRLIILTSPSKEYLKQYALLVLTFLMFIHPMGRGISAYRKSLTSADKFFVYYYKDSHEKFPKKIGLEEALKSSGNYGDVYIIGDVSLEAIYENLKLPCTSIEEHHFSEFSIVDVKGSLEKRLRFVMVKHSFWGSGAGFIAQCCAQYGNACAIIYIAKLGAISKRLSHFDFVTPRKYYIWENGLQRVTHPKPAIPSSHLSKAYVKETKHVSLPTLVEETTALLNLFEGVGLQTIDNEISYIAKTIENTNNDHGRKVAFSCLHIITDIPSSSILGCIEDINPRLNHLLSKNSFDYRKLKRKAHSQALKMLLMSFIFEKKELEHAI